MNLMSCFPYSSPEGCLLSHLRKKNYEHLTVSIHLRRGRWLTCTQSIINETRQYFCLLWVVHRGHSWKIKRDAKAVGHFLFIDTWIPGWRGECWRCCGDLDDGWIAADCGTTIRRVLLTAMWRFVMYLQRQLTSENWPNINLAARHLVCSQLVRCYL